MPSTNPGRARLEAARFLGWAILYTLAAGVCFTSAGILSATEKYGFSAVALQLLLCVGWTLAALSAWRVVLGREWSPPSPRHGPGATVPDRTLEQGAAAEEGWQSGRMHRS